MSAFSVTITPRFYETDAMGHINNATLAAWFEVVRVRYIESLAGDNASVGKDWILATITVDFLDETFYGSDVELKIVDATIGNTSLTVFCEMWQDNRLTVKGKAVVVHIDYDAKKPKRIPDAMRARV